MPAFFPLGRESIFGLVCASHALVSESPTPSLAQFRRGALLLICPWWQAASSAQSADTVLHNARKGRLAHLTKVLRGRDWA